MQMNDELKLGDGDYKLALSLFFVTYGLFGEHSAISSARASETDYNFLLSFSQRSRQTSCFASSEQNDGFLLRLFYGDCR